jgi:hypothetical protein
VRSLSIPDHVHHSVAEHGGSVLLNVRSGQWYAMNPVADALWQAWRSSGDFDTAVQAVAMAHPHTPGDRIDADARALAVELAARGLLLLAAPTRSPDARPSHDDLPCQPVTVTTVTAQQHRTFAVVAFAVAVVLLRLPFGWTMRLTSWLRDRWCRGTATTAQAAVANAAVRRVARWYPGRAACLELSLAAVLMLMCWRCRADWVIGAAADPLRFHAWVEVGCVPVVDDSDLELAEFRRVLKI